MKTVYGMVLSLLLLGLNACTLPSSANITSSGGAGIGSQAAESPQGPKARIAVADFGDKTSNPGQYREEFGRGLADMLTNALFQTNRFIVLDRDKLHVVFTEQDLGASGRFDKNTAVQIGQVEGAELLITGVVTAFDPGVSGSTAKVSGDILGALGGMVNKLAGNVKRAYVAMDFRVIDTRTSRVLAATSVAGSATAISGESGYSSSALGAGLGGFSKTPMEKALREMITKAADYIAAQTPAQYYHQ